MMPSSLSSGQSLETMARTSPSGVASSGCSLSLMAQEQSFRIFSSYQAGKRRYWTCFFRSSVTLISRRISYADVSDLRGIVVIDEVDLHLHAVLQHDVLPGLIRMFPKVQFIITTHSPLFVLGMAKVFQEGAFKLYSLPTGKSISPEEFGEFSAAYETFVSTQRFAREVEETVQRASQPIVYFEGATDIQYLQKASALLGHVKMLEGITLTDGNGDELRRTWKAVKALHEEVLPKKVVIVRDCDFEGEDHTGDRRRALRRIPMRQDSPIRKGIENLFARATLEKTRSHKPAFIDITGEHIKTTRGRPEAVPESWTINPSEKTNLCQWLCEHGTEDDFEPFEAVFAILKEALDEDDAPT